LRPEVLQLAPTDAAHEARQLSQRGLCHDGFLAITNDQAWTDDDDVLEAERFDGVFDVAFELEVGKVAAGVGAVGGDEDVG